MSSMPLGASSAVKSVVFDSQSMSSTLDHQSEQTAQLEAGTAVECVCACAGIVMAMVPTTVLHADSQTELIRTVAGHLREQLTLDLFGFDVIREKNTGEASQICIDEDKGHAHGSITAPRMQLACVVATCSAGKG